MIKRLNFLSITSDGIRKRPFSYCSRIVLVSIPYQSRIVLLSFSYRSRFRKRKQYGNNMRSIYAGGEDDTWWVHGLLHEDDDLFDKEQNNKSE